MSRVVRGASRALALGLVTGLTACGGGETEPKKVNDREYSTEFDSGKRLATSLDLGTVVVDFCDNQGNYTRRVGSIPVSEAGITIMTFEPPEIIDTDEARNACENDGIQAGEALPGLPAPTALAPDQSLPLNPTPGPGGMTGGETRS